MGRFARLLNDGTVPSVRFESLARFDGDLQQIVQRHRGRVIGRAACVTRTPNHCRSAERRVEDQWNTVNRMKGSWHCVRDNAIHLRLDAPVFPLRHPVGVDGPDGPREIPSRATIAMVRGLWHNRDRDQRARRCPGLPRHAAASVILTLWPQYARAARLAPSDRTN
jgi:hypothetical protein